MTSGLFSVGFGLVVFLGIKGKIFGCLPRGTKACFWGAEEVPSSVWGSALLPSDSAMSFLRVLC